MRCGLVGLMTVVCALGGCAEGASRPTLVDAGGAGRDASPVGPAVDGGVGARPDAGPTGLDGSLGSPDAAILDAAIPDASGAPDAGAPSEDAGATPDAGASPDAGGAMDAGAPSVDAGPGCTSATTCAGARDVGAVTGDEGATALEASGSGAEWLAVTVRDTGSTWNADSTIRATLTLHSLGETDYDLVVFRAAASMTPMVRECVANETSSARPVGEVDRIELSWPDVTNGLFASDGDGRILSVLVRHAAGPCDGPWRLEVSGNR
ncbi:MAG TPA: hypothetical protein RMH85_22915 [Polyangiaceae bacterium LLY-WYZ-15_(1-7)]|nr:hypothetical protein [Sandaracinus sp.]HJL06416.1 hypothetical protein [Polyangiaceae bacterium LLY-WYZ-15_(1-7)]MBJ71558.1 hypothetical protein [Sandaracinus sp.]HJL11345.1 hypothetical protein [Polyangiaceae bacterium LLY-WYZ-15_(1-7)]HJL26888.1 hypothetical protein [Polyangiaceae bacterium LLY-WYZ-15_(1-7)]